MIVDVNQKSIAITGNQMLPGEGPKALPINFDFSLSGANGSFDVDLTQLEQQGKIAMVQTVFVDMSIGPPANPLVITVGGTLQRIVCKPSTQGYYQILCPNPSKINFSCADAAAFIPTQLVNIPLPGVVWPTI
jgi:hypothetical protein